MTHPPAQFGKKIVPLEHHSLKLKLAGENQLQIRKGLKKKIERGEGGLSR